MIWLADNALTTLKRLSIMAGLPIGDRETDARLAMMINQASAQIERLLDRKLKLREYTDTVKATGSQRIMLREYPIVSVHSVIQREQEIDPSLYDFSMTGQSGILYKDDGWTYEGYPYGLAGDSLTGKRNITIRYTAGFILPKDGTRKIPATLPADIEGLALEMVQAAYGKLTSGGNAGLKAFSMDGLSWDWLNEMPPTWMQVIDAHKRVEV